MTTNSIQGGCCEKCKPNADELAVQIFTCRIPSCTCHSKPQDIQPSHTPVCVCRGKITGEAKHSPEHSEAILENIRTFIPHIEAGIGEQAARTPQADEKIT